MILTGDFNAASHLGAWPYVAGNDWPSDHAAVVTTFALYGAG